jgi:hypothetical protein
VIHCYEVLKVQIRVFQQVTPASLVEWLQTFRMNVVFLPSNAKQPKEDP